jgi:hypothetical protein
MPPPNPFNQNQQQQGPSVFDTTAPPVPDLQPSAAVNVPSVFAPPPQAPSVFSPLDDQEQHAQGRLQKLQYQDAHPWGSPDNHPGVFGKIAHGLSLAGQVAGGIFAPAVMANIPGTEANRQVQEHSLNQDIQGLEHQKVANSKEQADADREQQATQFDQELQPGKLQAQNDESAYKKAQTAKEETPVEKGIDNQTYDFLTKKLNMTPQQAYQEMQQEKGAPGREQQEQIHQDALAQQAQLRHDSLAQQMMFHRDHEQDVSEGRKDRLAAQTEKANKPTADEQKKADLVDNLNENLGVVEEIARRRPELFGPIAGRMTQLKNSLGTSDPDIGALETAQHQLGMVQQGVHGMKSAVGLQGSVDSLMNGFHNDPAVLLRSIETARNSAKTFSNSVGEKGQPGIGGVPAKGGGPSSSGVMYARDPQGKLHQAPAGTALPAGWKAEQR